MIEKTKIYKTLNISLRILIIVAAYGSILYEIFVVRDMNTTKENFLEIFYNLNHIFLVFLVLILMILNWGLETKKWQFLTKKIEYVPFASAFRAVLSGVTVSSFTPNRIGEYFGRVFILKKANPWKGVFITVLGSFSQMIVTLSVGTIATLIFVAKYQPFPPYWQPIVFWGGLFCGVIGIALLFLIYFNVEIVSSLFDRITKKRWKKISYYLETISLFSSKELGIALFYSALRYFVFSCQYVILLFAFGIPIDIIESFLLVFVIFFILTAIPSIALAEIGIRGSIAINIFRIWAISAGVVFADISVYVVSTAILLWIINIIFPALIGAFFVGKLKFFRIRKKS